MGNVNFAPGAQIIPITSSSVGSYFFAYSPYGIEGMFEIQTIRLIVGTAGFDQQFRFFIASGLGVTGIQTPSEVQFAAVEATEGSIVTVIDKSTPLFLRSQSSADTGFYTPRIRCQQPSGGWGSDTGNLTYWEVVYKFYRNINQTGVGATGNQNSFGLVNDLE